MAERAVKIENEHADEQIQVSSGESIQSDDDEPQDQFGAKNQLGKSNVNRNSYDDSKQVHVQGAYQPADYAGLPVSMEVKELFKSIQRYTPVIQELDTKLKAFIPDFIPAIGEVDAFLKMPRPDGEPEALGLHVLDEPSLNQSDKAKIDLMMVNNLKQYRGDKYNKIHSIENAEKNPKQIMSWIKSVSDIHKTKQPPSVSYTKKMPDVESLMQVWPQEVEQILSEIELPGEDIDLSLDEYAKVACNILDIPIHRNYDNNVIEAIHVMFTLYSAFKENQHFQVNQENQAFGGQ